MGHWIVTLLYRLHFPLAGQIGISPDSYAVLVGKAQNILRLRIALLGGFAIPQIRLGSIFWDTLPSFISHGQVILSDWITVVGGPANPLEGLGKILRDSLAILILHP